MALNTSLLPNFQNERYNGSRNHFIEFQSGRSWPLSEIGWKHVCWFWALQNSKKFEFLLSQLLDLLQSPVLDGKSCDRSYDYRANQEVGGNPNQFDYRRPWNQVYFGMTQSN